MTSLRRLKQRECAVQGVVSDVSRNTWIGGRGITSNYLSILSPIRQARSCCAEKETEAGNGPHLVIWNKIWTVSPPRLHPHFATQFEKQKSLSSCYLFSPPPPLRCTSPKLKLLWWPKPVQRKSHNKNYWAVIHETKAGELRRTSLQC